MVRPTGGGLLNVRDSVQPVNGSRPRMGPSGADPRAARGDGSLPARPGRAGDLGADAVAGRARRDQPDPGQRIAAGLELTLSQLLRLDEGGHVVVARAGERRSRERRGHRTEELTPPLPGQRADVSVHTLAPGAATASPGDPPLHEPVARDRFRAPGIGDPAHRRRAPRSRRGDSVTFDADLEHHFENHGDAAAEFLAVVAAGLRRG